MSASRTDLGGGVVLHRPTTVGDGLSGRELTTFCLQAAHDLGFARAGVATVAPFEEEVGRLERFLQERFQGEMDYLASRDEQGAPLRKDLRSAFPDVASAVSVAWPYELSVAETSAPTSGSYRAPAAPRPKASIAAYALYPDYHLHLKQLLWKLADKICEVAETAVRSRVCVDSAPVLERDLAVRAGFAFLGKNTLAIAPGAGSQFLLAELLLDLPLEPPSSKALPDGCGSCTACLTACPTDAFADAFRLDARRCISYLTIESQGDLPREFHAPLGTRVFGCDACQDVCPYNRSRKLPRPPAPFSPLERLADLSLEELLSLGSGQYKRLVQGTALRRASRNQLARNAAIALGNTGDPRVVPALETAAKTHPSPQVRVHAVWGLGQLAETHGVGEAHMALERLTVNAESNVAQEARALISGGTLSSE